MSCYIIALPVVLFFLVIQPPIYPQDYYSDLRWWIFCSNCSEVMESATAVDSFKRGFENVFLSWELFLLVVKTSRHWNVECVQFSIIIIFFFWEIFNLNLTFWGCHKRDSKARSTQQRFCFSSASHERPRYTMVSHCYRNPFFFFNFFSRESASSRQEVCESAHWLAT